MGAVFEARDRGTGQLRAIETLLTAGRSNHMERFAREARILSRIDHPHVVRIVDFGEADGVPYLAMDRLDGDNLSKVRPEGDPLPLLLQVAEAIEALHAAGIVHRDVKLANVQRTTGGRAVLLDFGLARTSDSTRLTRTGQVKGTMGCLAPELLAGREATPSSNWYAFGVMLFELLEG